MGSVKVVDYVIVGGGVAGLYAAWRLRKREPGASIVLIESTASMGGRARTRFFGGMHVPMGAGVGRMRDVKLKHLLNALGLLAESVVYPKEVHLQAELLPYRRHWQTMWRQVQRAAHEYSATGATFEDACIGVLGEARARLFFALCGYTDYLRADVLEVVRWYGMQDNAPTAGNNGETLFSVPWLHLIERMCEEIGRENIITNCKVQRVQGLSQVYAIQGHTTTLWHARKLVILALPGPQLHGLLPGHSPLRCLHYQPFIRVYAVLEDPIPGLKGYTVVTNELQKVIPMSRDGKLVMVAYADNDAARACWRAATHGNHAWFERRLDDVFHLRGKDKSKIVRLWYKYWSAGTHFFRTIGHDTLDMNHLQHVSPKMKIVGEAVSRKQGWVEGALESVDAILGLYGSEKTNIRKL